MLAALALTDAAAWSLAAAAAHLAIAALAPESAGAAWAWDAGWVFILAVLALAQGLYARILLRPAAELRKILATTGLAALVWSGLTLAAASSGAQCAYGLLAALVAGAAWPVLRATLRYGAGRRPWWGVRVLVVGAGGRSWSVYEQLASRPQDGLRPVGVIDDRDALDLPLPEDAYLGPAAALDAQARACGIRCAVLAPNVFDAEELASLIVRRDLAIRQWFVLPTVEPLPALWTTAAEVGGAPALVVQNRLASPGARRLKRACDLALALVLLVPIVPLLGLLAALVRFSSRGPVFYSQERLGLGARRFKAWKFRTMYTDADALLERYLQANAAARAEWQATHKLKHDPRVTPVGHWLRKTSLDELPQIWNVLLGEMSLVGPRPIVDAEVPKYGDKFKDYASVVPGITGLWQVSGRNNTTYPERVAYDTYYVRNWSPWLDAYILACTIRVVLLGEGAY